MTWDDANPADTSLTTTVRITASLTKPSGQPCAPASPGGLLDDLASQDLEGLPKGTSDQFRSAQIVLSGLHVNYVSFSGGANDRASSPFWVTRARGDFHSAILVDGINGAYGLPGQASVKASVTVSSP